MIFALIFSCSIGAHITLTLSLATASRLFYLTVHSNQNSPAHCDDLIRSVCIATKVEVLRKSRRDVFVHRRANCQCQDQ